MVISQWNRGRAIGRGSTATVFLAEASPSGHLFAVKSAELTRAALLQREHSILSALRHPNIVSSLGFDVTSEGTAAHRRSLYYNLFLEHVPGGSLSDELDKRCGCRLDEPAIRRCARDLLRGLAYLHGKSITHCDVKPQNVLLCSDGSAKLADFGCARLAAAVAGEEEENDYGSRTIFMGTPMFMAPEVARGEEQSTPADIWALGCTVVVMATGRQPWPGVADPVAALHRVAFSGDVPECPSWMSEEAKDFLDKCLKRDAGERWTAAQLLNHQFVAEQASFSFKESDRVWVSPKSTLEQAFWDDTVSAEEGETMSEFGETAAERIRQLAGGNSPTIDWRWDDEDWITVR